MEATRWGSQGKTSIAELEKRMMETMIKKARERESIILNVKEDMMRYRGNQEINKVTCRHTNNPGRKITL